MSLLHSLLEQNRTWADRAQERAPELFEALAQGQSPRVLWIGCADSRVPPEQIVDAEPGTLFVHRNVANVVDASDPNGMSVLQYAVESLEVDHIVVCGHYSCGGVRAALFGSTDGALEDWLAPVRALARRRTDELEDLDDQARWDRGCELNVEAQVQRVARTSVVQDAWERGQAFTVHGWIYQLSDGRLQDLDVSVDGSTFAQS